MILVVFLLAFYKRPFLKTYQICKDNGNFRDKTVLMDLHWPDACWGQRVIKRLKGASHLSHVYLYQ